MTAVPPGGDCPRWRMFLGEITDGDEELQRFLQRIELDPENETVGKVEPCP